MKCLYSALSSLPRFLPSLVSISSSLPRHANPNRSNGLRADRPQISCAIHLAPNATIAAVASRSLEKAKSLVSLKPVSIGLDFILVASVCSNNTHQTSL
ncbi:unnamed protein product [Eruca vesicaria subsp. sativa]|uniref:Uncharacterized protein n=1 Tax=Eruca vesicaria subsp. sativa TaxID=29727 RepID=A0ABC8LP62_ERUVS|nr:unnamed protein product [Eruca vesicaria subsp. sativa]